MTGRTIAAAAVAAWFLICGAAVAVGADSWQTARRGRGADDAVEGHRSDHHGTGAAPATDPPAGGGKALFEQKCGICHDLDRPLSQRKDKNGWTATVTRMRNVNGCPITEKEAGEIIQYLSTVRGAK
jgi:cytochrome c5